MKNLHKAYYKDYFRGLDFRPLLNGRDYSDRTVNTIKQRNQELCASKLVQIEPSLIVNQTFRMKIAYPGLVTGVGINHEAKIEGEFKLGVHFDYTWGMPVVYGSSVKGVLRAYFTEFYKRNDDEFDEFDLLHDIFYGETRNIALEKEFYKKKYQKECKDKHGDGWKTIWAEQYENNWENRWKKEVKDDVKKRKYIPKSIYNRDIFFDAVITGVDSEGRILCSDSITPHGDNPLKNPTPLTFLKIAAGCTMEFRFKLVDTVDENGSMIFNKDDKKALFEEIIKTVGLGAKTNVGYGQFQ